jgi:hypothetical protein
VFLKINAGLYLFLKQHFQSIHSVILNSRSKSPILLFGAYTLATNPPAGRQAGNLEFKH